MAVVADGAVVANGAIVARFPGAEVCRESDSCENAGSRARRLKEEEVAAEMAPRATELSSLVRLVCGDACC